MNVHHATGADTRSVVRAFLVDGREQREVGVQRGKKAPLAKELGDSA